MTAVEGFLDEIFEEADGGESASLPDRVRSDLDLVFRSTIKGYREVVLTMVVAKATNRDFRPTKDFYACNPRSLYEGPIRQKLTSLGVPRGKSGPLNIAKAAQAIDAAWAERRRDKDVADAVVRLARFIEDADDTSVKALGIACASRFLALARNVAALALDLDPAADLEYLVRVCNSLIADYPDGGNTPQRIAGFVLSVIVGEAGEVEGLEDTASTTNTTSKKAGDLIVRRSGIPRIIEVTVKAFDYQRMEDSYESIRAMDGVEEIQTDAVVVLCGPDDAPEEAKRAKGDDSALEYSIAYLGSVVFRDIVFEFVDIYEWLASQLATLTVKQRKRFHQLLNAYINDPNTSRSVKQAWKQLNA